MKKNYNIESKEYDTTSRGNVKYVGIDLNQKGWKEFFPDNLKNAILEAKNIENINSVNACKIISCNPTVKRFEELYDNFGDSLKNQIDKKQVIHNLRQIEKLMYRKNIYRNTESKIALGIWISSSLPQHKIAKLANISSKAETIRKLYYDLELNKLGLKGELIK